MDNKIVLSLTTVLLLSQNTFAKDLQELDTVTVTAQKTEENLQEVPISISVLNEFDIEDKNIKNISDIANYIPNFQQFSVGGAGMYTPMIRGLSAEIHTASTTVGTYIDGIPYTSSAGNNLPLEDIQSIEVLRGPQGTLYGKNAYAGALIITTKKPDNETKGKLSLELGSDNKTEYSVNVSGPIIKDKFYAGLSFRHYEKDGYIKNEYLNRWDDDREEDTYKLTLRSTPTDNLDILLVSTHIKKDDGATIGMPMMFTDVRKTYSDKQGYTKSKTTNHALNIQYDHESFDFTSITTHKKFEDIRGSDYDYSPNPLMQYHTDINSEYTNISQEFRINGQKDKLKWLSGIFLEKDEQDPNTLTNNIPSTKSNTEIESLGIFANGDYSLKDDLILTAGVRYDKDKIDTKDYLRSYQGNKSYSEVSPKIGLKYISNTNFMSYITVAKGYKSGGYHMLAPTNLKEYDKETLWNYEIGFKSKRLEDKLTFNFALFYMDIDNMQVSSDLTPTSSYVSNAATANSKGIEIEANYKVNDSLNFFANLGYAKTKFDKFQDNLGDYSGNYNPFAPEYNYSIGVKYRDSKGIFAQVDFNGQSSFYTEKENKYKNDGYTIANAKIGYEANNYDLYLYCNNITDKEYDMEGYFKHFTMVSPPREIGVQLTYRF